MRLKIGVLSDHIGTYIVRLNSCMLDFLFALLYWATHLPHLATYAAAPSLVIDTIQFWHVTVRQA